MVMVVIVKYSEVKRIFWGDGVGYLIQRQTYISERYKNSNESFKEAV